MAKKAKRVVPAAEAQPAIATKIAGALALIATRGMEKDDAALALDSIGFTAAEISGLLGVNNNYVMVARFRKKGGRKTRKKRG